MKLEIYRKYYLTKKSAVLHSERVRNLSARLFSELSKLFPNELGEFGDEKNLLTTAAQLHDIGYFIENEAEEPHNKIGSKLILDSGIDGFDKAQTLVIAALVRYHRGGAPNEKHKIYRELNDIQKRQVLLFTSILRVADALDCDGFEFERADNTLILKPEGSIKEERFNKKKSLFEELFGVKLKLQPTIKG